jgi:hypothetical protein
MKNLQQIWISRARILGFICLFATALSSCVKDQVSDVTPQIPFALISVINASPDAGNVDFYLDNNKANNFPFPYGDGLDYLRAYTGKRTATFYTGGTTTKIKADTMTLKANTYYSLYLSNLASKPDYLLTTDTVKNPGSGMATIRLVNVSPDAPALDLAIKGGAVIASNKAYRKYSSFMPLASGTYTLEVRQAGTTNVLYTLTDFRFYGASMYTVWVQGIAAATDATKLTAKVQLNVYFY